MNPSLVIATAVAAAWRNALLRSAGGSRLTLGLGAALTGAALGTYFVAAAALVGQFFGGADLIVGGREALVRIVYSMTAVAVAAVLSVLISLSPPKTALDNVLATKPVTAAERQFGLLLPLLVVTCLAASIFVGPFAVAEAVSLGRGLGSAFWHLLVYLAQLVVVSIAYYAMFTIVLSTVTRWLRVPRLAAQTLALVVSTLVTLGLMVRDVSQAEVTLGQAPLGPLNAMTLLLNLHGEMGFMLMVVKVAALLAVLALAFLAAWAVGLLPMPEPAVSGYALLKSVPPPPGTFGALAHAEFVLAVRHHVHLAATALLGCVALGAVASTFLSAGSTLSATLGLYPLVVLLGAAVMAETSYGRTRKFHWVYLIAGVATRTTVLAKVCAAVVHATALGAALLTVTLYPPLASARVGLGVVLAEAALALMVALFMGAVIPFSEEYPFSSALTSVATLVGALVTLYAVDRVGAGEHPLLMILALLVVSIVTVTGLYYRWVVDGRHSAVA